MYRTFFACPPLGGLRSGSSGVPGKRMEEGDLAATNSALLHWSHWEPTWLSMSTAMPLCRHWDPSSRRWKVRGFHSRKLLRGSFHALITSLHFAPALIKGKVRISMLPWSRVGAQTCSRFVARIFYGVAEVNGISETLLLSEEL